MVRLARLAFGLSIAFASLASARADQFGATLRASVPSNAANADGASFAAAVSSDGAIVAFSSRATNLVPGDSNGRADVFVWNRSTRSIELVSLAHDGAQGDGDSGEPALSADGRCVAFSSRATNLVPGDTNGFADVFVRDRVAGTTERVSLGALLNEGDDRSIGPAISADGRFVAFTTWATNFTPADQNFQPDVYAYDRVMARSVRVSRPFLVEGASLHASISADGRYVAFQSTGQMLFSTDANGAHDVFVRDLVADTLVRLSNAGTAAANGASEWPSISSDAGFVAFESRASDLVVGDTNARRDVFAAPAQGGPVQRVSVTLSGVEGDLDSRHPAISADGRWIVFESAASNFDPHDSNLASDVFLADRQTGAVRLLSRSSVGLDADQACGSPALSADAAVVAFESASTTLAAGDSNALSDVFVHAPFQSEVTGFCAGDGTAFACPCANPGAPGRGCDNSLAAGGARLELVGLASVSADSLVLRADGMPDTGTCLYYQGSNTLQSGLGAPFGDGLRCLGGIIVRLGVRVNSSGASGYGGPLGDVSVSVRGQLGASGGVRHYQAWYRDSATFCAIPTFNLSNAVTIAWSP